METINKLDNRFYLFTLTMAILLFDVFTHNGGMTELTKMAVLGFITFVTGQADGRNQSVTAALASAFTPQQPAIVVSPK
jgi:hypothetical protein